jgi:hypothetical protein
VSCTSARGTAMYAPTPFGSAAGCPHQRSIRRNGVAFPGSSPPRRPSTASSTSGPPTRTCTRSTRSRDVGWKHWKP